MTIRIHSGFKLTNITSLDDVQPYIKKITKEFTNVADDIWGNIVVSDACILYDFDFLNKASMDSPYMADALEGVEEDLVTAFRKRIQSQLDLEVLLYFKQIKGKHPHIVGIYNIPNEELRNKWANLEAVEDFSFVSGVKPNDISKSVWGERELTWKRVFRDTWLPETSMFSINVLKSEPRPVRIDEIQNRIPNIKQRAMNLAHKIVIGELKSREGDFETQEDVFKHLKSKEHKKEVKNKNDEILKLLDENLTTEKLGVTVK